MTTKDQGAKPAPKKPAKKPVAKKKATGSTARVRKPGRPSSYTEAIGIALCAAIAEGMSLRSACALPGMPDVSTVIRWLADEERAEFCAQYARAREDRADLLAEEILQIADDGRNDTQVDEDGNVFVDHDVIARSRLRVDARKWLASKMAPKKYGDKITAEHTGANGGAIQVASTVTFVRPPARAEDE
ncbi:hypothetical protein [Pseudomonas sp. C11]|uniref:terminase small subunit-like protein n=1 Tax=Pseudomonas sp. C11 TaxID=3075550 RepID=UPI002AFFA536|nr:hypothetical protein [Pseudomonas sp. C11]